MQRSFTRTIVLTLLAAAWPASALSTREPVFLDADGLVWLPAPPSLPRGATFAMLQGDPAADGPYTLRLRVPGAYVVAPHFHPRGETLTVLRGTLFVGIGDVIDKKTARALKAGAFHQVPPRVRHYAYTVGPAELQVSGEGPFDSVYLRAADDPATVPAPANGAPK
ncbi:cupin domain-containing protein [Massilia sp. DWR3-1-1]|uniref:cupin domain-containing protein n=1 Tax=Massilia sp. DWR3-1-1 TaxID=2804559 RepID=UPI003CF4F15F